MAPRATKDALQLDWGHWESKDPEDNLDDAIRQKTAAGYPTFNIIFENAADIILIQHHADLLHRAENLARIKKQHARKISVILGNPPYHANQMNENERLGTWRNRANGAGICWSCWRPRVGRAPEHWRNT